MKRRFGDRQDLADAGLALLQENVPPHQISGQFGGVDRRRATEVANKARKSLGGAEEVKSVPMERLKSLTSFHAGIPAKHAHNLYSEKDRREAVYRVATGQMTATKANGQYGIPLGTIKRDKAAIFRVSSSLRGEQQKAAMKARYLNQSERRRLELFGSAELEVFEKKARKKVDEYDFGAPGRKPLFETNEENLLVMKEAAKEDFGLGASTNAARRAAQRVAHGMAPTLLASDVPADRERGRQLLGFKASASWLSSARKRTRESIGVETSLRKPQAKSQSRAKADQLILNKLMHTKISDYYEKLYKQGKLSTPQPTADQVWNGDEIGFDARGGWNRILGILRRGEKRKKRRYVIRTGEKSPFWSTMFFVTRADGGSFVPPYLVHQGTRMRADFAMNLDGTDIAVGHSDSGYMDKRNFMLLATHLVDYMTFGGKLSKPQFLFLDGHDSHFDASALAYMKERNVHVFFLKSADSENDQVSLLF